MKKVEKWYNEQYDEWSRLSFLPIHREKMREARYGS